MEKALTGICILSQIGGRCIEDDYNDQQMRKNELMPDVKHDGWPNILYKTFGENDKEHLPSCLYRKLTLNALNPELNPICYLLALLTHHFLHVSRIRVKSLTLRLLMSYIYGAPILDVSRSHTTTQHSR